MLQTYRETTSVIDCLIRHDYDGFIKYELKNRLSAHLPPYSKLAIIMITAANQVKASDLAKQVKNLAPHTYGIKIMGPAPAMLSKLKGRYRYNILVINQRKMPLQNYLKSWIGKIKLPSYASLKIDIDPYSLV
jgi:primosomal protein N' (replication factor Y)